MATDPADQLREVKCPFCPMCGTPPNFIWEAMRQCVCPNEDCQLFMWVPWDTAAANLADVHTVELPDFDQEPPPAE